MATTQQMTAEDLARIEEPGRYDLIRGEIIYMPPAGGDHGEYGNNIGGFVWMYVRQHRLGKTFNSETGFLLSRDPDTVLVPDSAFVSTERLPAKADRRGFMPVAPDLAVEVVSPSDRDARVTQKAITYLEAGTRFVWVVYPDLQIVKVYTPDLNARILRADDILDGGDVLPGFELQVAEIFEEV